MSIVVKLIMITAIAGVLGTGFGGLIGVVLKRDSSKIVSLLLAFAGGIMMAVVCFDLLPDALSPDGTEQMPVALIIAGTIIGYAVVYGLNYLIDKHTNHEIAHIDESHPKTADDLDELIHSDHLVQHIEGSTVRNSELFIAGLVMAFAIALHNMPEGMVIGASYAADAGDINGGQNESLVHRQEHTAVTGDPLFVAQGFCKCLT